MTGSPTPEHRIPVIVGVGEMVDRPAEITAGLEPLALMDEALRRAEQDSGATAAWRGQLARRRQFSQLALPRSGKTTFRPSRHRAEARLLRPGRRRKPDPLSARGGATHCARGMQRRRGLRRRSAVDRDQGRARRPHAAVDAVRPRCAGAKAWRRVPEADGGQARRVQADYGLSAVRGGDGRALGPDPAPGAGGIRRFVVDLFRRRRAKSVLPG